MATYWPLATGEALFPLQVRLRRPNAREIAERFGDVMDWARALEEASREVRDFGSSCARGGAEPRAWRKCPPGGCHHPDGA